MTDERLKELLQNAVPPSVDDAQVRDRWPDVAMRFDARGWSYIDLGLAAAAALALTLFPEWFWLLSYHL